MRAEGISEIQAVRLKIQRWRDLIFPKIHRKKGGCIQFQIFFIPCGAVNLQCQFWFHQRISFPGSAPDLLKCILMDQRKPHLFLFFQTFKVLRILPGRISRHLLREHCVVTFRLPADIAAVLHRKVLYLSAVCFQFCCKRINRKKLLLFFTYQACIADRKPMVRCRMIIIKRQFRRLLFLRLGCRMRKTDLKAFFCKRRDPHFHRSPVSRQKPERNHRNKCPVIDIYFCYPSVFHSLLSVPFSNSLQYTHFPAKTQSIKTENPPAYTDGFTDGFPPLLIFYFVKVSIRSFAPS